MHRRRAFHPTHVRDKNETVGSIGATQFKPVASLDFGKSPGFYGAPRTHAKPYPQGYWIFAALANRGLAWR